MWAFFCLFRVYQHRGRNIADISAPWRASAVHAPSPVGWSPGQFSMVSYSFQECIIISNHIPSFPIMFHHIPWFSRISDHIHKCHHIQLQSGGVFPCLTTDLTTFYNFRTYPTTFRYSQLHSDTFQYFPSYSITFHLFTQDPTTFHNFPLYSAPP